MEFNNINLFTQNAAALNKAQGNKEVKVEEDKKQPEVKDNRPAQQYSADEVFNYMAGSAVVAKAKGLKTIALTGKNGGKLKGLADICIIVPQNETFMIQELHLPVYHALCLEIEEAFWAE